MCKKLVETARMTAMMDVDTVVVGIKSAIAITMVEMDLDLAGVHTALNAEVGMEVIRKWCRKTS